jgi:hypothetical protein
MRDFRAILNELSIFRARDCRLLGRARPLSIEPEFQFSKEVVEGRDITAV